MSGVPGLTLGMKGTAEIVVGEQHTAPKVGSGRLPTFRVTAVDAVETIGEGTHERVVVTLERFDQRVQKKAAQIR